MRIRLVRFRVASAVILTFSLAAFAQAGQQQTAAKTPAAPAPKRDLSGVWQYQGAGGAESFAAEKDIPPMTPWAKAKFDEEIPGYGSRARAGGNDPILQCDPIGFPRVMFMPTLNTNGVRSGPTADLFPRMSIRPGTDTQSAIGRGTTRLWLNHPASMTSPG